jgi:hypothetical protein
MLRMRWCEKNAGIWGIVARIENAPTGWSKFCKIDGNLGERRASNAAEAA